MLFSVNVNKELGNGVSEDIDQKIRDKKLPD